MKDVGLFLTSSASVFIAIFTGVNLVYKELERKTIYTIMSKPIHRPQFLAGKYLGLAAMAILVGFMGMVLMGLFSSLVVSRAGLCCRRFGCCTSSNCRALSPCFFQFLDAILSGLMTSVFPCRSIVDVLGSSIRASRGAD